MTPAEYRQLADQQTAASDATLDGLDLTTDTAKLLLGLVARINSAVYLSAADILEAVAIQPQVPSDKKTDRLQRLRRASIRGDNAEVERIIAEIHEELTRAGEQIGNPDEQNRR